MVKFFHRKQTQVCTQNGTKNNYIIDYVICIIKGRNTQSGKKIEITHDSSGSTRFHELELEHTQALFGRR